MLLWRVFWSLLLCACMCVNASTLSASRVSNGILTLLTLGAMWVGQITLYAWEVEAGNSMVRKTKLVAPFEAL